MTEIDLRRPQLVADGHIPTIAPQHDGRWGVHCEACSRIAEDYVWPCREGVTYDVPAVLVAASPVVPSAQPDLTERARALYSWQARIDLLTREASLLAELEQTRAERDLLGRQQQAVLDLCHNIERAGGASVVLSLLYSRLITDPADASPAAAPQTDERPMWDDAALALLLRAKSLIAKATHYMNGTPDNSPWHKDASRWVEHHAAFTGEDEHAAAPVVSVPTTAADTSGDEHVALCPELDCDFDSYTLAEMAEHVKTHAEASGGEQAAPTTHGWTFHGHPCCGKAEIGERPNMRARCMGYPGCRKCRADVEAIHAGFPIAPTAPTAAASGTGTDGGEQP